MSGKPILLLDVDGVCNAVTKKPDLTVWPDWSYAEVLGDIGIAYPMWMSNAVIDFLRRVHADGLADIRWHTTWQDLANERVAAAFGLPEFPVVPAPEFTDPRFTKAGLGRQDWWKLPAALRALDEGRPVAWLDDDLRYETFPDRSWLTIAPRTNLGLAPKHLRILAEFLGTDLDSLLV